MNKAVEIKRLPDWQGDARLYNLAPPMKVDSYDDEGNEVVKGCDFVVVSAVVAPFSGPETYIFASDENGEDVDFTELDGSFRGGLDHSQALKNAGYEVR